MSKGANLEVQFRFTEDKLRSGTSRGWRDDWQVNCKTCGGTGVHRNQQCATCAGNGFVVQTLRKPIEFKIPPGSRPGQRLRIRGYGYSGDPDTPENRGDLIVVLRLFGDGEVLQELQSIANTQKLPPARPIQSKLPG